MFRAGNALLRMNVLSLLITIIIEDESSLSNQKEPQLELILDFDSYDLKFDSKGKSDPVPLTISVKNTGELAIRDVCIVLDYLDSIDLTVKEALEETYVCKSQATLQSNVKYKRLTFQNNEKIFYPLDMNWTFVKLEVVFSRPSSRHYHSEMIWNVFANDKHKSDGILILKILDNGFGEDSSYKSGIEGLATLKKDQHIKLEPSGLPINIKDLCD